MIGLAVFGALILIILALAWRFEDYITVEADIDDIYIIFGGVENEQDSELE